MLPTRVTQKLQNERLTLQYDFFSIHPKLMCHIWNKIF